MLAPSRSASGGARGERRTEMAGLVDRMVRAAKLEPALYEEVEADTGATSQAMIVVVLSSLAAGVGSWPEEGVGGAISSILLALGGWVAWAFIRDGGKAEGKGQGKSPGQGQGAREKGEDRQDGQG
jgi:hypothetical protein